MTQILLQTRASNLDLHRALRTLVTREVLCALGVPRGLCMMCRKTSIYLEGPLEGVNKKIAELQGKVVTVRFNKHGATLERIIYPSMIINSSAKRS